MIFKTEAEFEEAVIDRLVDAGWVNHSTGQPEILRYKTEKELIKNWADILFENNNEIDRLNDVPLTEGEMHQILEQIKTLRTPVRLNGFINGKTVTVKRDNPDDKLHFGKEISLKIYDRQEIAGGQSRYQIAQQPKFTAKTKMLSDRRGDFTLLINGMPVIHVELKKSGIPVSQACYQIQKYAHEGVFTGLFSLVQVQINAVERRSPALRIEGCQLSVFLHIRTGIRVQFYQLLVILAGLVQLLQSQCLVQVAGSNAEVRLCLLLVGGYHLLADRDTLVVTVHVQQCYRFRQLEERIVWIPS